MSNDHSNGQLRPAVLTAFWQGTLPQSNDANPIPPIEGADVTIHFSGSLYHRPRTVNMDGTARNDLDNTRPWPFDDGYVFDSFQ